MTFRPALRFRVLLFRRELCFRTQAHKRALNSITGRRDNIERKRHERPTSGRMIRFRRNNVEREREEAPLSAVGRSRKAMAEINFGLDVRAPHNIVS